MIIYNIIKFYLIDNKNNYYNLILHKLYILKNKCLNLKDLIQ